MQSIFQYEHLYWGGFEISAFDLWWANQNISLRRQEIWTWEATPSKVKSSKLETRGDEQESFAPHWLKPSKCTSFFQNFNFTFWQKQKKTLQGMMRRCSDGRNYGRNYDRFKNICGFWWEMLNTLYRIWVCWCIVLQGTVIVIHGFFFSPPCNYVM